MTPLDFKKIHLLEEKLREKNKKAQKVFMPKPTAEEKKLIDQMYEEDLYETNSWKYDKSMYCDLFCPAI